MPRRPKPFETTASDFATVRKAKLEKFGNWWYARSYIVWFIAASVWLLLTVAAAFSAQDRLVWVCGFVTFLHIQRGWELRKMNIITSRIMENERKRLEDEQKESDSGPVV